MFSLTFFPQNVFFFFLPFANSLGGFFPRGAKLFPEKLPDSPSKSTLFHDKTRLFLDEI